MDDAVILPRRLGIYGLIAVSGQLFCRRFNVDIACTDGPDFLEPAFDMVGPHLRPLCFQISMARHDAVILVEIIFHLIAIYLFIAVHAFDIARSDEVIAVRRMKLIRCHVHIRLLGRDIAFHVRFGCLQIIRSHIPCKGGLIAYDDDIARRFGNLCLAIVFQFICRHRYRRVIGGNRNGSGQEHGTGHDGCQDFHV